MTKAQMFGAALKCGFRINTMLDREARRLGSSPTPQLASTMRDTTRAKTWCSLSPGASTNHSPPESPSETLPGCRMDSA